MIQPLHPHDLVIALAADPEQGLAAAAVRVGQLLVREAGVGGERLDELGRLAADGYRPVRLRVAALYAVAHVCATTGLPVPALALEAAQDPEVIDAALGADAVAALTGVLAAAPKDLAHRPLRKLLGRRLLSAGQRGPHITRLLVDAWDVAAGLEAACDDVEIVMARAPGGDDAVAWAAMILGWFEHDAERLFVPFVRALHSRRAAAPAQLARQLGRLDWLSATSVAACQAALLRAPAGDNGRN